MNFNRDNFFFFFTKNVIHTNLCSSDSCVSHLFPFFVSRSRKSDHVSQVSSHGCRRDFSTEYLFRLLTQKNKHYYVHTIDTKVVEAGTKGCLSLFNYFIDMSPTLLSPFFVEKTCFFLLQKHVFLTKNGLIYVGLMSIHKIIK